MEILEIRSSHDLSSHSPTARKTGSHSYQVNTRQFATLQKDWQRNTAPRGDPLCLMTLGFERIWITEAEIRQVAEAIQMTHSPVSLD